jgi:hypothetical protein
LWKMNFSSLSSVLIQGNVPKTVPISPNNLMV